MKITIRTKQLSNGQQSIYLDIYHVGKRRYEFLNLYLTKNKAQNKETKALAEKIRAKRELELANDEYGFSSNFKKKASFLDYFQTWIKTKNENSIYDNAIKKLKEFTGKSLTFQEIDDKWIEKYKSFLIDDDISQNTAKNYFDIFKRVLKQATRDKIISHNPAALSSNIKSKDIKRDFLSIDEIKLLSKTEYNYKYPDIKKAFLFSCFTGLRLSDVNRLKWENVKPEHIEIQQQKTSEYIYIPLSQTAKSILFQNPIINLQNKLVFKIPDRFSINIFIKKWFADAGIEKNGHYHMSRHTFAVMNITQGAELYTVSKLLGHKNLKTTEIYGKLIDEKKKAAINNLPVIEVSL